MGHRARGSNGRCAVTKGLVIEVGEEPYVRDFGTPPEASRIREVIGGWLEAVAMPNGCFMYVNEEGKLHGLPQNPRADALVREYLRPDDYIVGNAVIFGPPDDGIETDCPMTPDQV